MTLLQAANAKNPGSHNIQTQSHARRGNDRRVEDADNGYDTASILRMLAALQTDAYNARHTTARTVNGTCERYPVHGPSCRPSAGEPTMSAFDEW